MNLRQIRVEKEIIEKEYRSSSADPADLLCIELRNLAFRFKTKGLLGSEFMESSAVLPQGGLYSLVGPPSEGKGTVLKLFGDVLVPFVEGEYGEGGAYEWGSG